jgi:SAM-dependent methyltransferase
MAGQDANRERIEAAVRNCYSSWGKSYYEEYYGSDAPYPPVHVELIRRLVLDSRPKKVLDAGCGPASFLRHLSGDHLDLFGFDLTAEMVDEGKRIFRELGLEPERLWQGSVLDGDAYRGLSDRGYPEFYDAAVCVGVLPHIAPEHDERVFTNLRNALRTGGLAIVEARNKLFSLFTLNRPSYEFIRDELVRADALLSHAGDVRPELESALDKLKTQFRMDLPIIRRGKGGEPGYDEVVSRTHNPFTVRHQFERAGFRDVRVLFYHFHAVPPMFAAEFPDFFRRMSFAMEDPEDWRGHFMASAFLVAGTSN